MSSLQSTDCYPNGTARLHPQLMAGWDVRELFDGTLYFDPSSDAEQILLATRLVPTADLARTLPELGRGTRSLVLNAGSMAIKRCEAGNRPNITGLEAVIANVALATAFDQGSYSLGGYSLRACMPRGYFEPKSVAGKPTWAMDHITGKNAQDIVHAPAEATDSYRPERDALCRLALEKIGIDPSTVFLDSGEYGNIIIDDARQVLTIIDVAAPAPTISQ